VEGQVHTSRHRDLAAEEALRCRGVVVEDVADVPGLPARVAEGMSRVADLQVGELVDVLVDDRGEPAQEPRALARGHVAPGRERLLGALDEGVGLLQRGQGHLGDRLGRWRG
jgi:hypothetical protein